MKFLRSNKELRILKTLQGIEEGLTAYQITKIIESNPHPLDSIQIVSKTGYISKLLNLLEKQGLVIKIRSTITFFKLSPHLRNSKFDKILYEVRCPKCKSFSWAEDGQKIKTCKCFTKSKKPTKFWLTKNRFTGNKKII